MIPKKIIFVLFIIFFFQSCKKEKNKFEFEQFQVFNEIIPDSISKKLNKFRVNNNVISEQSIKIGFRGYPALNQNYICQAYIGENDTLNVWINNYNGYFGNGILLNIFKNEFKIKSVDPNIIKGIKFEEFVPIKQELILDKSSYKKGDSIFGRIIFECNVDSVKHKKMYGYFRTKIQ